MLTTSDDSRQIDRLEGAIKAYRLASGQTLAFAMIHTARKLAYSLHAETVKIAPSESSLRELPGKLGWRIKRRKGGGRFSVNREIARRIEHRKFIAAGWIPAMRGLSAGPNTVTTVVKKLGAVIARVSMSGEVHITLRNNAGHTSRVFAKYPILRKSINRVFSSFRPYIKSHLSEAAAKAFSQI